MAVVSATITVDFTANYAGDHRVCWRIQGSGSPYDCSTVVNCVGGATVCQAIFNADVNTTSCDGMVTFEGYVQATCEDILSTNGRLAFTVDFTPTVVCQRYEITCDYAGLDGIGIVDGGLDYLVGDTVVITRDPLDTQTSDGNVTISAVGDGVINSITSLLSAGTGYLATEILTVVDSVGIGAGATITIDSVGGSGEILTYTLTTNGTDYTGPLTFTGGSGVAANFDIVEGTDYDAFGKILSFTVVTPGLYDIAPAISITTGTGSGFDGIFTLEVCGNWAIGNDCVGGDPIDLPSGLSTTETFGVCVEGALGAVPVDYTATAIGCCIATDTDDVNVCTDYHFTNTSGGPIDVQIMRCGGDYEVLTIASGTSVAACLVADGFVDPQTSGIAITNTGNPCT